MTVRRSAGDTIPGGDEVMSRVFDASRSLVFEVWTKAEHFSRWFGPHGAEVVSCEIDARPGGVIRFGHRAPDGHTFYFNGTFIEVVPDERLAFVLVFVDEHGHPRQPPMFAELPVDTSIETVVTLDDAEGGTRVSVAHRLLPADAAAHPAGKHWSQLARQGSTQVFERLGEHLSLIARKAHAT